MIVFRTRYETFLPKEASLVKNPTHNVIRGMRLDGVMSEYFRPRSSPVPASLSTLK